MWRYEIKFIVDQPRQCLLENWRVGTRSLRRHHPTRMVHSIYYDAPDMRGAMENLMGLPDRRKTRLRWYGDTPGAAIRLEVKERNGRLGRKSSADWPESAGALNPARAIKPGPAFEGLSGPISLSPTLGVSYRRDYLMWDAGIRVTIDTDLSFTNPRLSNQKPIRDPSAAILEVKFAPNLKSRAHDLIADIPFYPLRHSKYLRGLDLTGRAVYV